MIETRFTLQVFRTVDRWYIRLQNLAKAQGLLASGREAVRIARDGDRRWVVFPGLSEEGWPPFRVPLPGEAVLSPTTAGMFYRGAHFLCRLPPEELGSRYRVALAESGIEFETRESRLDEYIRTTDLGGDVRLRVGRPRGEITPVSIGQYRGTGSVEESLRRAAERREGADDMDWGPEEPDDPEA